jgi:syntaxin 5
LSQTCAKLEKLSELARRGRSLFDDRQWEIDELTQIIQQDIHGMNQQIGALQAMRAEHSGTHRAQDASHSKSVVVGLQSRLAGASQTFKRLLESRTQALRAQKSRRDQFSTTTIVPSSMPPSASSGYRKRGSLGLNFAVCVAVGSVLLADDLAAQHGAVAVDMSVVERSRQQQQMLLMDEQQSYAQARADTMLNIESNISELGQIFKQLANLVAEQGETIQRYVKKPDF